MELTTDERKFLKEVEDDLNDDSARLVYADWLEERGDPRGEYLRLEYELGSGNGTNHELNAAANRMKHLKRLISPDWLALVSRATIEGCAGNCLGTRKCVNHWRELQKTDQPTIRVCHDCGHAVHFCTDLRSARWLAGRQGSRVAVESTLERAVGDMTEVGVVPPQDVPVLTRRLITAERLLIALNGNQKNRKKSLWRQFPDLPGGGE